MLSLVGLLVLIALVGVLAWHLFLVPILREKLEAMVAAHLDASLSIGRIDYRPPFTVHLDDVHFLAHPTQPGGATELLSAKKIELSLAQLPFRKGPLIIQRFGLAGLTVHAIRQSDGQFLGLDLARGPTQPSSPEAMKLSDVLRLRHFSLKDATLIYQDQSDPRAAPTQWQGISSDVALEPQSASLYGFSIDAADAPIARAAVKGTIDVDSLLLQINQMTASAQAPTSPAASGPDPLPASLRALAERYAVKGTISLSTTATIPLKATQHASINAQLGVEGGGATLPVTGEKLDDLAIAARIQRGPAAGSVSGDDQQIKVQLIHFRAVSGGAILSMSTAAALFDPASGAWSLNGLSGAMDAPPANHGPWELAGHADFHADIAHDPHENQTPFVGGANLISIHLHPPGMAAPVDGLTGTIRFAGTNATDRLINFRNFSAIYGGDRLGLDHAQVSLAKFPDRILVSDIESHLNLVTDAPPCPGDLGPIVQTFQPSGPFRITGAMAMQHVIRVDGPGYSPEWDLNIATENGAIGLFNGHLPVTELAGHMLATKHAISIPGLQGKVLGGEMNLVGTARVVEPIVYQGELNVANASVEQFAKSFNLKTPDGTLPSGLAKLKFKFFSNPVVPATTTTVTAAPAPTTDDSDEADEWLGLLGGEGSLQIDDGDLWALPALQTLRTHTQIARKALTAGEAAAVFTVASRTIFFKHVAIYSPALGLQGSGSETFAGNLNLDIIAAPLGDWKQKLAETDIPFFSRVLSSAAGSIEKFVGNATSELLYHFRITGTRDNPQVQTIPAPFITDSAATLFARMIRHDGNTKLVDAVNEK